MIQPTNLLFKASTLEDALANNNYNSYLSSITNYFDLFKDPTTETIFNEDTEDKSKSKSKTTSSTKQTTIPSIKLNDITFEHVSGLSDRILGFLEICRMFPDVSSKIKITSGYRPGATTSNGSTSFHASGDAIDIIPTSGNFDELSKALFSHPEIINYLRTNNLGILDETRPDVMKKTKATGKHFHIGPDRPGISGSSSLLTKYGYA